MLPWSRRAPQPSQLALSSDAAAEQGVAERLLSTARDVVLVPGSRGADETIGLIERLALRASTEVLCPPDAGPDLIGRLLGLGFTVYDSAAALDHSVLILDRRVGWRVPPWEPVQNARSLAHRLLWTRIGQYSRQCGVVETIHHDQRLFQLHDSPFWINAGYRDLPFPPIGSAVEIVGLFSSLGGRLPMLHALRIAPLEAPTG
jgi:hypothetical protein